MPGTPTLCPHRCSSDAFNYSEFKIKAGTPSLWVCFSVLGGLVE